jgi:nucleoid-associated protein YgaU
MPDKRTRKEIPTENASEYYSPLREKRGVKKISQFKTPVLKNPTIKDRTRIKTITHMWKYGNRLYNLSNQFYGDSSYWWVIAWWNGVSTEAQIKLGTVLYIPLNIEDALDALGV